MACLLAVCSRTALRRGQSKKTTRKMNVLWSSFSILNQVCSEKGLGSRSAFSGEAKFATRPAWKGVGSILDQLDYQHFETGPWWKGVLRWCYVCLGSTVEISFLLQVPSEKGVEGKTGSQSNILHHVTPMLLAKQICNMSCVKRGWKLLRSARLSTFWDRSLVKRGSQVMLCLFGINRRD